MVVAPTSLDTWKSELSDWRAVNDPGSPACVRRRDRQERSHRRDRAHRHYGIAAIQDQPSGEQSVNGHPRCPAAIGDDDADSDGGCLRRDWLDGRSERASRATVPSPAPGWRNPVRAGLGLAIILVRHRHARSSRHRRSRSTRLETSCRNSPSFLTADQRVRPLVPSQARRLLARHVIAAGFAIAQILPAGGRWNSSDELPMIQPIRIMLATRRG